jgi:hypothetical protein
MPRLPECSITQTWLHSSRQTSMKWLPPPSVPIWFVHLENLPNALSSLGCFSVSAFESARTAGRRPPASLSLCWARPTGTSRLIWSKTFFRLLIQIVGRERQTAGHHAAADVDAHGCRDDGLVRGDHRTDGGADAQVHIRHGGDVMMNEGQAGDVGQLLPRLFIDVIGPDLDRDALRCDDFPDRHCVLQKNGEATKSS